MEFRGGLFEKECNFLQIDGSPQNYYIPEINAIIFGGEKGQVNMIKLNLLLSRLWLLPLCVFFSSFRVSTDWAGEIIVEEKHTAVAELTENPMKRKKLMMTEGR